MASDTLSAPDIIHPACLSSATTSPFASVEIHTDAASILEDWATLETGAPCSIYQTRGFVLPWLATLGRRAHFDPLFVLARDRELQPTALLCLGTRRCGPIRVATWLGGKDSNFNMALLRRPAAWSAVDIRRLLREAASARSSEAPDVFELPNQPLEWIGACNPFAQLRVTESPSAAYGTSLPREVESLFATKLSKDTRKKLRKKEAKLAAIGPLTHRVAERLGDQRRILDVFLAQKTARFHERGIASDFATPEMRAFIEAASAPRGTGIELHALLAGERIVAVYGGAAHDGQWSGMFNSFDADDEVAKTSPGDLLLMRILARCCAAGLSRFDLGIGEARYKAALCNEAIPLFDAVVPVTLRGRAYAAASRLRSQVKHRVKRDPRLLRLANRLRGVRS